MLLNRFIYETPYTLSGVVGQSTNLADQHKKKTILTVEKHFPYMKKRLLVTSKQVVTLSPIENSLEAVEQRTGMSAISCPSFLSFLSCQILTSGRFAANGAEG